MLSATSVLKQYKEEWGSNSKHICFGGHFMKTGLIWFISLFVRNATKWYRDKTNLKMHCSKAGSKIYDKYLFHTGLGTCWNCLIINHKFHFILFLLSRTDFLFVSCQINDCVFEALYNHSLKTQAIQNPWKYHTASVNFWERRETKEWHRTSYINCSIQIYKTRKHESIEVTGNLILICENMTWMEALSYCRENYMDLVLITEQSTQDLVGTDGTEFHIIPYLVWSALHLHLWPLVLERFVSWLVPELGPWTRTTRACISMWSNWCHVDHRGAAVGGPAWEAATELYLPGLCRIRKIFFFF